jgi:hypothetical protein
MKAASLVLVLVTAACGPKLVWHGKSPDRARDLRVVEHRGQYIVLDGQRGRTYDGIGIGALAFSADSRHLAYAARRGSHWRVVIDGREGPPFDGIASVFYSADSAHVAYAALRGRSWHVVVDGKTGPAFDALLGDSLQFGGARFAYVATRATAYHAVVDGVVGPRFDGIAGLTFSAAGAHVGYLGRRGNQAFAVIDGVTSAGYTAIDSFAIAGNGRSGYIALDRGGWHAVVDGTAGPARDLVRTIAFSSDGAHVAYVARREQGDTNVVVDGVEGASYTGVRPATLVFPHGNGQPSFVAQRDFRFFVVRDGVEGPVFDDVRMPVHSADGAHWAYVGRLADRDIAVIDGVEYGREARITDLVIAPRGGKVAYVAPRGAQAVIAVDAREHTFDIVLDGTVVFDASGAHWGCIAGVRAEKKFYVIVDGARTSELDITEAIDLTTKTQAAGLALGENDRILRQWIAAEVAKATG